MSAANMAAGESCSCLFANLVNFVKGMLKVYNVFSQSVCMDFALELSGVYKALLTDYVE